MSANGAAGPDRDPTARLRAEGLYPGSWSNGPGDRYGAHDHAYDKVLVVASGSIRFGLPDLDRSIELAIGDRLELPAGTLHDAIVGGAGVTCLEAHVAAGTFADAAFRASGDLVKKDRESAPGLRGRGARGRDEPGIERGPVDRDLVG